MSELQASAPSPSGHLFLTLPGHHEFPERLGIVARPNRGRSPKLLHNNYFPAGGTFPEAVFCIISSDPPSSDETGPGGHVTVAWQQPR